MYKMERYDDMGEISFYGLSSELFHKVGCSFLVRKQDKQNEIIYCYAARELAYCKYKLHSEVNKISI